MGNRAVPNNRHYHQGKYQCLNPDKYLGDLESIYFRSSWEKKLYYYLDTNNRVLKWAAENIAPCVAALPRDSALKAWSTRSSGSSSPRAASPIPAWPNVNSGERAMLVVAPERILPGREPP